MRPPLVLFDCDGVLVDSEIVGNKVFIEVAAEHGVHISLDEALRLFRGAKMTECVAEVEQRLGYAVPDDFVQEVRRRTTEAFHSSLETIPGALDVVRLLPGPKCVVSNGPREKIELSLSITGLLPYFQSHIFSAYEVGVWKPDPELFLHAARTMGFAPKDCIVVEDSMTGIRAGLEAGMRGLAFQPHGNAMLLPKNVAVFQHLSELPTLIGNR